MGTAGSSSAHSRVITLLENERYREEPEMTAHFDFGSLKQISEFKFRAERGRWRCWIASIDGGHSWRWTLTVGPSRISSGLESTPTSALAEAEEFVGRLKNDDAPEIVM